MVSAQKKEIFCFERRTTQELIQYIEELIPIVNQISIAEMTDLAYHLAVSHSQTNNNSTRGSVRAVVIATDPKGLANKLQILKEKLHSNSFGPEEEGIYCRQSTSPSSPPIRIGFLFPGQASQQINMSWKLLQRFSEGQETLQDLESYFKQSNQSSTSKEANPLPSLESVMYKQVELLHISR